MSQGRVPQTTLTKSLISFSLPLLPSALVRHFWRLMAVLLFLSQRGPCLGRIFPHYHKWLLQSHFDSFFFLFFTSGFFIFFFSNRFNYKLNRSFPELNRSFPRQQTLICIPIGKQFILKKFIAFAKWHLFKLSGDFCYDKFPY